MSFTKTIFGTVLFVTCFSVASFADTDDPIKSKNKIRKNYKTATLATTNYHTSSEVKVKPKKRKGAYHIQNKAGVNTLAEANKVNAGKKLEKGTRVYPYSKWKK